ncbi:glycosyltransferase [Variovorax sp. OV329]|uniref:glycosyltransferase n=1 Tax=Variovorax sp. OV329 TaxID=1882825 RepID=UPI0008F39D99|nr:glycosyltransferase [Variovorax sp. OV329]SFN07259.1 hypothetical protein SAMN05444747_11492 [Variovorax sp. OV329]
MRISLVINTLNRMHTLPTTMEALKFLRYPELEVVVVDGPSTDGTMEYLLENWKGKVKICKCEEANLSKSRNVGIKNAVGDIVCFTDDDGVPEPDWLDRLVTAYEDPRVGAAGGWVRNHTGVDYQTKYIVSSRDSTSEVLIECADDVPDSRPAGDKFPGLIGVNSSFRRSALIDVGGFDEAYAYFLDETDVLARMVDAGYRVAMIPDAEVHHKYASSHIRTQSGNVKSWLQIIASTSYYIVRNAAPTTKLLHSMEKIASQKKNLMRHTDWYLSEKMIDTARHAELLAEIEAGFQKGVLEAFEYPCRRLIGPHDHVPWQPFAGLLPARERLRIALVTPLYPPRPCGGVAVFMNSLAERLASFGHEVTVITQAEPGRHHTVDFESGVWVHRLPDTDPSLPSTCPDSMPDMPGSLKLASGRILAEIDRVNARRKIQFVIGAIWDLDMAAVIASKRYATGVYLVTSYKLMEDSKPEWKANKEFYEAHVKKMIRAEAWALGHSTRIFASTQAILRDTEQAYGIEVDADRLSVLPFGVQEPSPLIAEASLKDGFVNILFVGRFERRKGADLFLDCLPELFEKFKEIRITCIGDNTIPAEGGLTYFEIFQNRYHDSQWFDRITFLGHVDNGTLEQAYAECDIFVAPSRYESFGLIYLEAMRFGKACIGCDVGGIPEVVESGKTGLLVPPGDRDALYAAIARLVEDAELRARLGEAGRQRYGERFTTEKFANEFALEVTRTLGATVAG